MCACVRIIEAYLYGFCARLNPLTSAVHEIHWFLVTYTCFAPVVRHRSPQSPSVAIDVRAVRIASPIKWAPRHFVFVVPANRARPNARRCTESKALQECHRARCLNYIARKRSAVFSPAASRAVCLPIADPTNRTVRTHRNEAGRALATSTRMSGPTQ